MKIASELTSTIIMILFWLWVFDIDLCLTVKCEKYGLCKEVNNQRIEKKQEKKVLDEVIDSSRIN